MKIFTVLLAMASVIFLQACQPQSEAPVTAGEPAAVVLDTHEKRLSYGIAVGFGKQMQGNKVALDAGAFQAGLMDVLEQREPRMSQEEINEEMTKFQQASAEKMAVEREAKSETNTAEGIAFLAQNASREGVVVTESGLQYEILTAGTGDRPGPQDTVEVHYRGTLLDGTEFDSSYKRDQTVSFALGQVIPGWTEALQLMPVGSKWQLAIPSDLAYGSGGAGQMIGPNSTLLFDVELVSIASAEAATEG